MNPTSETLAELLVLPMPERTEAEWAAWDAEVERKRLEERAEAERSALEMRRSMLIEQGVPVKELERAMGGALEDTKAVGAARAAISAGLSLLVLSGPRGCGKTTAASWWLMQPRRAPQGVRTHPLRFADAPTLARWPRYDEKRMAQIERASALVVDDLGMEYDDKHGAFRSFVDGLVNARYATQLPTAITTNLPVAEFRERYGERVADRIRECGRFVELAGESLRKRVTDGR